MENSIKKFLEFNGKVVSILARSGVYWVALKPICDALGVQYVRQFKNAKKHPIWSQLLSEQTMVGADDKARKMVALPEQFIYGWIAQIRSNNQQLIEYQLKCCNILYEYFHGSMTNRENLIREKTKEEVEIDRLEVQLRALPEFQRIEKSRLKIKALNKNLRELDSITRAEQLPLFTGTL
jgi:hypothetical protein